MMNGLSLRRLVGALLLAGACGASFATPVMEMRAEDLVPMAAEFRNELKLTPNQLTLWQRVESRSKTIVRERQSRRERLQASLKSRLELPKVELRELDGALEAENAATVEEDKQMRAMWLEMNDALDDNQRQQVASMIGEQLMRVAGPERRESPRGEDKGQQRSGKRGGRGGMGGMGGGTPGS